MRTPGSSPPPAMDSTFRTETLSGAGTISQLVTVGASDSAEDDNEILWASGAGASSPLTTAQVSERANRTVEAVGASAGRDETTVRVDDDACRMARPVELSAFSGMSAVVTTGDWADTFRTEMATGANAVRVDVATDVPDDAEVGMDSAADSASKATDPIDTAVVDDDANRTAAPVVGCATRPVVTTLASLSD